MSYYSRSQDDWLKVPIAFASLAQPTMVLLARWLYGALSQSPVFDTFSFASGVEETLTAGGEVACIGVGRFVSLQIVEGELHIKAGRRSTDLLSRFFVEFNDASDGSILCRVSEPKSACSVAVITFDELVRVSVNIDLREFAIVMLENDAQRLLIGQRRQGSSRPQRHGQVVSRLPSSPSGDRAPRERTNIF